MARLVSCRDSSSSHVTCDTRFRNRKDVQDYLKSPDKIPGDILNLSLQVSYLEGTPFPIPSGIPSWSETSKINFLSVDIMAG